jgi:putative RecB family exonuclease
LGSREYRSVSQFEKYERCPYSYYLSYEKDVWRKPAAWLPQGTAVHEAAEWWELSDRRGSLAEAQEVYSKAYDREINELCQTTPNFDHWYGSGWRYPAELDIPRRHDIGLEMVARYLDYYGRHPEEKPWVTPNGDKAVELMFEVDLAGIIVRGMIDLALRDRVRDNKTGKKPGSPFQLATYKVAVEKEYDLKVLVGDYWMGDKGKPTKPYDLTEWSIERVTDEYGKLDENIRAESFDPRPSEDNCRMCSVADSCPFRFLGG